MADYSYSRLSTFENCPLQYKFVYIDRIKREKEGIEAFLGSRFHEVMERLYRDLPFKIDTLGELLAYYEDRWQREFHDKIVIARDDRSAEDYRNLGRKCIEDYYRRYHPFDQGRIFGIERKIKFDLDDSGKYSILGYIDRLVLALDGAYEIHDYKTSGALPEQKNFDEDRQLGLYQIGIEKTWRDVRAVRLVWHYVAFDKEMVSTRTRSELEALKADLMRLIDTIERTMEFEARESELCDWCYYWDLCPKKKHLVTVAALSENEYLNEPGLKLVDSFAELMARKKNVQKQIDDIDAELERIKEAVIEYAKKEGVDVLRGTGHKLRVALRQRAVPPAKGTEERAALEEILKECGVWDEVAGLDAFALEKAMNEKRWTKLVLDRILPRLVAEQKYSVTLSKLKEEA